MLVDARDYYRAFYRAALRARRYIALTGWQFDSGVALVRGEDAHRVAGEVRLLPLLRRLCRERPGLRIYLLAWNFSPLLVLEREWLQRILFNWTTCERLVFRFDKSGPLYGSHHQKLVLVDGLLAFTGGMDIADSRWDERAHPARSSLRHDRGRKPHGPYHDVQAVLSGPVVGELTSLFEERWRMSGGGALKLPVPEREEWGEVEASLRLPPGPVALSRTFGKTLVPPREAVREVRALYLDAIDAAEHFLYLENQYFSSRAIFQALTRRMRASGRPRLQVVLVLPEEPEALREQLAMGLAQARLLRSLRRVARETGHRLGIYRTVAWGAHGREVPTYIHSKLMVVDDRFLTVGSANTTNRSLGLDSELNLGWESTSERPDALGRAIRRLRVSLLVEHTGLEGLGAVRELARADGLVSFLDRVAAEGRHRLRPHRLESVADRQPLLREVLPADLVIDPEDSVLDESLFESMKDEHGLVASGVKRLTRWLVGRIEPAPEEATSK